ncbi:hypothetical protein [Pseudoroseicyclus sp. CXY001]|uniref:hypothetical protein n=1 Tax=Pseudoroseicyclus sp. CXY001 TaxID=3242492 RepID=UPI00358DD5CD
MTRLLTAALAALTLAGPLAIAAAPAAAQSVAPGPSRWAGPPSSYTAHTWTDPRTGCSYARAQAPGYLPTWHLIINGSSIGLTDARGRCPGFLASQS